MPALFEGPFFRKGTMTVTHHYVSSRQFLLTSRAILSAIFFSSYILQHANSAVRRPRDTFFADTLTLGTDVDTL